MKKISKAEFVAELCGHPSVLVSACAVRETDELPEFLTMIDSKSYFGYDRRTVAARKATYLEFSNGSRLYLEGEYYKDGSALCNVKRGTGLTKIVIYKLVNKSKLG